MNASKDRPVVAVLAGTHREFLEWELAHKEVRSVFCDRWPKFAGLKFSKMVECGTFRQRKDAFELWLRVAPMVREMG